MAAVTEHLVRSRSAFAKPTLALLNKNFAAVVIAIFNATFTSERKTIAADQFHLEVENHAADLGARADLGLDDGPARTLCSRWVREKWLIRNISDSGSEEYALTSHAQQAMEFVARAQGDRALVSESRLRTLLDTIERFSLDAAPDRTARVAALDAEIARLQAERDYLVSGGEIAPADAGRMAEQFENVNYLVRELPADFTRVAESIKDLQRVILTSLRQDERPTGQLLSEYLTASENLMAQTQEGRAFVGAMELLENEQLLTMLDSSVSAILRHPFAVNLTPAQKTAFRGIKSTILASLGVVLTEQQRASRTLTAQIRNHNPLRDQELDEAIRDAISGLATWLPTSVRGQRVTPLRRFQRANFGRLKTSVHDLSPDSAPKELDLAQDVSGQGLELEELLALGGPRHADLVAHLEALSHGGDPLTIARAFERGGAHLKRPVEIFGYQEIAAGQGQSPTADLEQVRAVRPDGTAREFIVSTTPVYGSVPKENHV